MGNSEANANKPTIREQERLMVLAAIKGKHLYGIIRQLRKVGI